MVMLLTCIWGEPSLDLGWDVNYSDWDFHGCPQSLQPNARIVSQLGHDCFLLYPFKFTCHSTILPQVLTAHCKTDCKALSLSKSQNKISVPVLVLKHWILCIWMLHGHNASKMHMAICSSKTSVDTQRTMWRYSPEDSTLHNLHCENLKSLKLRFY
jgi:hypothetical protein